MADDVLIDNGQNTDFTGAADEIGGVLHQRVKVQFGEDGSATDASLSDPLPVTVSGVATAANQSTANTSLGNIEAGTGLVADAAATAGSTGSVSAKLRLITSQLDSVKTSLDLLDNIVSAGRAQTDVLSLPAAARTTDAIAANLATDAIMNGLTVLTPKFKSQTITASQTDTSVVAAVTSKKIRVLALVSQCAGTATTITFESDGGSDTRLHKIPAGANGGQSLSFNPVGWFETLAGEALIATTGAGSDTDLTLVYCEV